MMADPIEKYEALLASLRALGGVAVAFSAGVDSTFLLYAAHEALGDRTLAVTARAVCFPESDTREAQAFCAEHSIRHLLLDFDPLGVPGFRENPRDRCYHCKRALFEKIVSAAAERGSVAVAEGTNVDDEGDYRPGMRAIAEKGVKSPLREAGFTKAEIRALSKRFGLPVWDKPSAACLASRIAYGETITEEKLRAVGGAEALLRGMGFRTVRVRMHGDLARIEVAPAEIARLTEPETRATVAAALKELGFVYTTADLTGYRTGSMNEATE